MTPEVRLSPDGQQIAIRTRDSKHWPWHGLYGNAYTDDLVSEWTPLTPPAQHAAKQRYTIVAASDDHKSSVDMYLTPEALAVVTAVCVALNKAAKWSVDIRMNVESSAAEGEVA